MTWLMEHQTLVTWGLAFLAALTALAAGYVQGWFALRGIRDQIAHADQRAVEQEERARAALVECLKVDLGILGRRLEASRMQLEDAIRAPARSLLTGADLILTIPDTVGASWRELARLPPHLVGSIRKLSVEMTDIRELAVDPDATRDGQAFAQAALRRVNRATTTLNDLAGLMGAESPAALLTGTSEMPALPGVSDQGSHEP
ncbi:MAG: hypothetical protein ACXWUZ_03850 [Allosphingosinicella sp.]